MEDTNVLDLIAEDVTQPTWDELTRAMVGDINFRIIDTGSSSCTSPLTGSCAPGDAGCDYSSDCGACDHLT
jgi:hypothetical protein